MKIISNKLYNEYTKTVIGYHTNLPYITKEDLYDVFKFHCAGVRPYEEVVDYIYKLIEKDRKKLEKKEMVINILLLILMVF